METIFSDSKTIKSINNALATIPNDIICLLLSGALFIIFPITILPKLVKVYIKI